MWYIGAISLQKCLDFLYFFTHVRWTHFSWIPLCSTHSCPWKPTDTCTDIYEYHSLCNFVLRKVICNFSSKLILLRVSRISVVLYTAFKLFDSAILSALLCSLISKLLSQLNSSLFKIFACITHRNICRSVIAPLQCFSQFEIRFSIGILC